jgi:fumarylacetoacetate (FAA) hydrolase
MKFIQFRRPGLRPEVGIVHEDRKILPLFQAFDYLLKNWSSLHKLNVKLNRLQDIIEAGDTYAPFYDALDEALFNQRFPSKSFLEFDQIQPLSPLRPPSTLICGYSFRSHEIATREAQALSPRDEFEESPIYYYGNPRTVVDPGELTLPARVFQRLDYQLEWAAVIGKGGRSIPAEVADEHIFGFTLVNNWASRELEEKELRLGHGPMASRDFATTVGPWVVTPLDLLDHEVRGEHGSRYDLWMRVAVGEKNLSLANARDMSWTFAQLIEAASQNVTLQPGDLVTSGPAGGGTLLELNGSRRVENFWLKPEDKVTVKMDQLGEQKTVLQLAE